MKSKDFYCHYFTYVGFDFHFPLNPLTKLLICDTFDADETVHNDGSERPNNQ